MTALHDPAVVRDAYRPYAATDFEMTMTDEQFTLILTPGNAVRAPIDELELALFQVSQYDTCR